jgi:hypothetical protein
MTPLRTLKPLLLLTLALCLAWLAQTQLRGTFTDGAILYSMAIALFLAACAHTPLAQLSFEHTVADTQPTPFTFVRLSLLGGSTIATFISIVQFTGNQTNPLGWLFHFVSVCLFILAFVNRPTFHIQHSMFNVQPSTSNTKAPIGCLQLLITHYSSPITTIQLLISNHWHYLVFFTILTTAIIARFWQLDVLPFGVWYDEAFNGNLAARILQESSFRPIFFISDTLPAHLAYLFALSFHFFGVSAASMRFVTATFGVITVIFAYLLFRRWLGERMGLIAAALFAVMRYDLTFSRIAMHGVTTPAFEVIVLYLFDRALAHKKISDCAWTGLALGYGLAFYTPFRAFPLILLAFTAALALAHAWRQRAALKQGLLSSFSLQPSSFAIVLLGMLIASAPVAQFALQQREVFMARTSNVSIFERRDEKDLGKALWNNTVKHLLMFNAQGDRNGRHNLPNEPMLDPITGALFVLGLAYGLWRWRDPANFLMLLVFCVMNLGGILSVDFEAPQSLRSIGVMPALVYFALLPLAALTHAIANLKSQSLISKSQLPKLTPQTTLRPPPSNLHPPISHIHSPTFWDWGLAALLITIAYHNLDTYFNKQRYSPEAWAAHSAAETIAAREMNRLAPHYDLVLSSLYAGHPTVRFLAPTVTRYTEWTANDHLPLAREPVRGVAMILDPLLQASYDEARRYYPLAQFQEFKVLSTSIASVFVAQLSPDDLLATQGVVVRYFNNDAFEGKPSKQDTLRQLSVDWTVRPPLTGTFTAELRSALYVEQYGAYRFTVRGAPNAALFIDENPISDTPIVLAKGNHAVRMRLTGSAMKAEVWWQPPNTPTLQPIPTTALFRPPIMNSGLLGAYYPNPNWTGPPVFMRIDSEIAFYFHNTPLPRPYSVEWRGKIFAPVTGLYRFATESIDTSQLRLNQQLIIDNRPRGVREGSLQLSQGWHELSLRYTDETQYSRVYLYWTPPSGAREIVPARYLLPPMGQYPSSAEMTELLAAPVVRAPTQPAPPPNSSAPATAPLPRTSIIARPAMSLALTPLQTIGARGNGPAQFNDPHGIAISSDDRVYVADTGNRRVQVLDGDGNFITALEANNNEKFVEPFDVVIASTGDVLVLDADVGWIYRFDANGRALGRFAGPAAQFYKPRGMAIDSEDNLYIADTGGARIVKLSLNGERLKVFGARGNGRGQFLEPSHVAVDAEGFVFATDVPNKRINVFHPDGHFVADFPIPLANPFNGPHIAFTADQALLVTAPEPHKIQHLARDGKLLNEWGNFGSEAGQFRLPTALAVSGDVLWIVDTGNQRVQKWGIK